MTLKALPPARFWRQGSPRFLGFGVVFTYVCRK